MKSTLSLKPFHQGKLDLFCAMYAVLNALQITHNLRVLPARELFNETLLQLAAAPEALRRVLAQETDYLALVDGMLKAQSHRFALQVEAPFAGCVPLTPILPNTREPRAAGASSPPSPERVWETVAAWLAGGERRAVIFRFIRYLLPGGPPVNLHWTTAHEIQGDTLHFFDCSHEECAIYSVPRGGFVTHAEAVHEGSLLCLEAHTLRLVGARR